MSSLPQHPSTGISWFQALKGYFKPAVLVFLFLGFSCGIPMSLIGYSLSLWLDDTAVGLAVIGFFALVLLPYNFKFLWAPLIDKVRLPILADCLGARKAWLIIFQLGLIGSIIGLACFSPDTNTWLFTFESTIDGQKTTIVLPMQTYLFALLTAFFAASQDIVVDALRIATLKKEEYGEGAGLYQFGYRMGMLLAGAGVVALSVLISWQNAYLLCAFLLSIGFVTTFFVKEPVTPIVCLHNKVYDMFIEPFHNFIKRHQYWLALLFFIVLYKLCNAVLGRMALPFYKDMDFSKYEIALISGTIGPWVTIFGIALGGILVMKKPILKLLFALGCIEILTSVVFAVFSLFPHSVWLFIIVILFDNIVGGMGGAVFVAFLSGLCAKQFAATQYALLTGLMMFAVSVISVYSGIWAENMGWFLFFIFTGCLMIPALILLSWLIKISALTHIREI